MVPSNLKAVVLPTILYLLTFSELNFVPFLAAQSESNGERHQQGPLQSVLIRDNTTLLSANRTFELGFFSLDGGSTWYAGISYASISIRTHVWVANSETPVVIRNTSSSSSSPALSRLGMAMGITSEGRLAIVEDGRHRVRWTSRNSESAASAELLETGNLVLVSAGGTTVWQSFDFPGNTWLPDMKITPAKRITGWRSSSDPAPGNYSLRLRPPLFGEFELVYGDGAASYWSTGNWTGDSFANVPEMTVPYIYTFRFNRPFTPAASFTYSESSASGRILTRFVVDPAGMLRQYVWSPQTQNWLMFWSRPESPCSVYALCGELGFCQSSGQGDLSPCQCLPGFAPADSAAWATSDFSSGCRRSDGAAECAPDDSLRGVGAVSFTGAVAVSLRDGGRASCEAACLSNCSCLGVSYISRSATCQHYYGRMLNLRNLTGEIAGDPESRVLYLRIGKDGVVVDDGKNRRVVKWREAVVVGCAVAALAITGAISAFALRSYRVRRKNNNNGKMGGNRGSKPNDDDAIFSALQLTVFSYKDLTAATRGFSEKLGHGGFGGVFLGELAGGARVAVKRLERPGGAGEREFRAEVCTIGSVQHVNLVRLRGFCCERAHRLLVYEYHPNGPLSAYLGPSSSRPPMSWEARFRIALGTARGLAYLHEECRSCIIHCDIKPENILLGLDYGPKVSDFGLAKLVGRDFSRVAATMRGTWGYVAPEWISGTAITAKADVYSYGMTLLEIIGGRRNVEGGPEGDPEGNRWFFPPWAAKEIVEGRVEGVADGRLGGCYDRAEATRAGLVAVWCIQDDEAARPSMGTVVKMLEGTVEIGVPPAPVLLQALVAEDSFAGQGGPVSGSSRMRSDVSLPDSRLSSSF